jgi:hypothetical protein
MLFRQVRADILPNARPENVVNRVGVPLRNAKLLCRPPHGGHDGIIGFDEGSAKVRNNQINSSRIAQFVVRQKNMSNGIRKK